MPSTIDNAFVKQFESEIHLAYQRMGTKLMNTTRRKTGVVGSSTTFQTLSELSAAAKGRSDGSQDAAGSGTVVTSYGTHAPVEVALADIYTSTFIDKLDELKIQHDERAANSQAIAASQGRETDALIVGNSTIAAGTGLAAGITTNKSAATTGDLDRSKVEEAYIYLGNNDVPDDGDRFLPCSPRGWATLMAEPEFSSADYVGYDQLVYGGMVAKRWWGFMIFSFTGLDITTTVRDAYAYHRSAVGFASGQDFELDVTWQGLHQAHLLVGSQSQGCEVIDADGVFQIQTTEA